MMTIGANETVRILRGAFACAFVPCFIASCATGGISMTTDERQILDIIDRYASAANNADADLLESLFWHEDSRFSEVENHIPAPFGQEVFLDIGDWIRRNAKPGQKQRFYDTVIHLLSESVAYSVSLREDMESGGISRVTLLYVKKDGVWKIMHGHFSVAPD